MKGEGPGVRAEGWPLALLNYLLDFALGLRGREEQKPTTGY